MIDIELFNLLKEYNIQITIKSIEQNKFCITVVRNRFIYSQIVKADELNSIYSINRIDCLIKYCINRLLEKEEKSLQLIQEFNEKYANSLISINENNQGENI